MEIRKSVESEKPDIARVHKRAFGQQQGDEIVRLVNDLFDDPTARPLLSLVCVEAKVVTGHVLFTKVAVVPNPHRVNARILAPLAVVPEAQGQGLGTSLIREGLQLLRRSHVDARLDGVPLA